MGRETDALLAKRAKYRLWSWLLLPVGLAGFVLAGYVALQGVLAPFRQRRGPFDEGDNFSVLSVELMRDGNVTPELFVLALLCAAFLVTATFLFRGARKLTAEMKQTDAEVSRRLRVEERIRERR
jgi:hypothetical protein